VAIPDFSAGAMENWGLVLYRESSILHDDVVSSVSNKLWVSLVISHEIAHTVSADIYTAEISVGLYPRIFAARFTHFNGTGSAYVCIRKSTEC